MPSAHKLQANLGFFYSGKQICSVPTNYKQISVSVVQENIFAHKLQANYNIIIIIIIIIKSKNPQDAGMNLKWS
jgi:hypothetical protein